MPQTGAMVVPATYLALRDPEIYENPDEFDPERYYTGDAEVKGAKNFLVFGTGPHVCLGQHYAQLNLVLMLGKASLLLDWTHHPTPLSEEIKVFATIFPKVRRQDGGGFPERVRTAQLICNSGRLPIDIRKEGLRKRQRFWRKGGGVLYDVRTQSPEVESGRLFWSSQGGTRGLLRHVHKIATR